MNGAEMNLATLCQRIAAQGDENQAQLAKAEAHQAALDRRLDRIANKAADLRSLQNRFDVEGETIEAVRNPPAVADREETSVLQWLRDTHPFSLSLWTFFVGLVVGTGLTQFGIIL